MTDDPTYREYLRIQTEVHGQIVKPVEYHRAEQTALRHFFARMSPSANVLDVGCGVGLAMAYLKRALGFHNVHGIELNERKAFVAQCFGYSVEVGDVAHMPMTPNYFDAIYCSHTFEHMLDPDRALAAMLAAASKSAALFFILPYPDTGDPTAHCASGPLGLRVKDAGESVDRWFTDRGLRLTGKQFSTEREPEVWLSLTKAGSP